VCRGHLGGDRFLLILDGRVWPVGLAGAYAVYAVAAAISLPFVWALVTETKGKTLEQM